MTFNLRQPDFEGVDFNSLLADEWSLYLEERTGRLLIEAEGLLKSAEVYSFRRPKS